MEDRKGLGLGNEEESQEDNAQSRCETFKGCCVLFLRKEKLIIAVFTSVILGFIVGVSINSATQSLQEPDRTTLLTLIGFPGELLVRMLRMLVLPLIVCSLIVGLAGLEKHASGRVGRRAVVYYLGTTFIAAVLGLIIVVIIQPGKKASVPSTLADQPSARTLDSFLDLLRLVLNNFSLTPLPDETLSYQHVPCNKAGPCPPVISKFKCYPTTNLCSNYLSS